MTISQILIRGELRVWLPPEKRKDLVFVPMVAYFIKLLRSSSLSSLEKISQKIQKFFRTEKISQYR